MLGKTEIWKSLQTDSLTIALRRLHSAAANVEFAIEQARSLVGQTVDATLLRPRVHDPVERPSISADEPIGASSNEITLAAAYQCYIDDPTQAWSPSTRQTYETCRKLSIAVIGVDVPVASISRAHCRNLLEVLRFLPTNAAKRFPKLSPTQAADRARKAGDIRTISAANANSLMANLSTFLNWAVDEEMLARNPARGLRLPDQVAKRRQALAVLTQPTQDDI